MNWYKLSQSIILYHGTSSIKLDHKFRYGGVIDSPSHWGSYRVAEYNADVVSDGDGGNPMVIRLDISRFDKNSFSVDRNSTMKPLAYTLGKDEAYLSSNWKRGKETWQDSLRIYESVIYNQPMPISEKDIDMIHGIKPNNFQKYKRQYELV